MDGLCLRLLGPLETAFDGQSISGLTSARERALLVYLAMEAPHAFPRESLCALLWPELPAEAARANLRNALTHLRHALSLAGSARPCLLIGRDAVQFDFSGQQWVDARAFEDLLAGAASEPELEEALTLCRGPFLEGFALKDAPAFDDWALLTRERLERAQLDALRRLAALQSARGDHAAAAGQLRRGVELQPLEELGHRELMRQLALHGQRTAALEQYERCRVTLAAELGVELEAETLRLYEQIRDGQLAPPEPASPPLPTPLLPLVGRERELAELAARLREPSCRLLSVVGPGGCGKTRLALEAARQVQAERPDGAHHVPLSAAADAAGLVQAIAQGVGLRFYASGQAPPRQQLLDYFRDRRLLLLLDGCEHLLDPLGEEAEAGELVAEILETAPGVTVLATSRARLGLVGEEVALLEGLAEPAAAELFTQGARRVRASYRPAAEDLSSITQLCRWAEGLPLAILLASAWVELLSPAEIVAQMAGADGQRLDLLAADFSDLPERQRSMRAVFDHSWALLAPPERETLAALALFRGGFTAEAAREVAGASLRDLLRLANRSLLSRRGVGRYELHDLLRDYAAEKLAASGRAPALRDCHAAYYALSLCRRWRVDLAGPRQSLALDEVAAELPELRAAWEWAAERAQVEWLDPLMDVLGRLYDLGARHEEGEQAFAWIAGRLGEAQPSGILWRLRSRALSWQSNFAFALEGQGMLSDDEGVHARSRQLVEEALQCAQEATRAGEEARLEMATAMRRLAMFLPRARHAEREALYRRALALALEAEDDEGIGACLVQLGEFVRYLGRMEESRGFLEKSLAVRRQLGGPRGIKHSLVCLWWWAWQAGRQDQMEALAAELAAMDVTHLDRAGRATHYCQVARLVYALGRRAESVAVYQEGLALWRELGARQQISDVLHTMAAGECHLGRYAEARVHAEEGLRLACETGHWGAQIGAFCALAWTALAEGRNEEAERYAREDLRLREEAGYLDCLEPLGTLAIVALREGRMDESREYVRRSLLILRDTPMRAGAVRNCLPPIALHWAVGGDVEKAVEIYALAATSRWVTDSRFLEDIAGREVRARAAVLPPEVRQAAEERGRRSDPAAMVRELLEELGTTGP